MSLRKSSFSLLEVMVVITLITLASASMGWKVHGMVAKKRFSSNVERLRSRLFATRQIAVNTQEDFRGHLVKKGATCSFQAWCVENPKTANIPLLSMDFFNFFLNGEEKNEIFFDFTSSGDIFPQGCLQIRGVSVVDWTLPDLFSFQEGEKSGPVHPDELKNGKL